MEHGARSMRAWDAAEAEVAMSSGVSFSNRDRCYREPCPVSWPWGLFMLSGRRCVVCLIWPFGARVNDIRLTEDCYN